MIRTQAKSLLRFYESIPTWLLAVIVGLPLSLFGLGYLSAPGTSTTNLRTFLSTLATAQAGVLAIVFSVAVIAIQLVSTRYSPRLISLFIESSILKFTFWLFVASLVVDFSLIYVVPQALTRSYTAGVFAAGGLALASFVTLYVFIQTVIRQSTPDGIIETFIDDLTPEKYLATVQNLAENNTTDVHPLRPLYSMIMEALSNRERTTAETALDEYGDVAEETLSQFIDDGMFEEIDRQTARELFEPVFKEQLHDIALHAEDLDESQLVGKATEIEYKLGKKGLELPNKTVSRQAVRGLTHLIIHSAVEENRYSASNSAWDALGGLLVDAAEDSQSEVVQSAASTIESRVSWQLGRVPDYRRYEHSMDGLYRDMKQAHESLLDQYESEVASVEMDWQHEHVPDENPHREIVNAVRELREALFASTAAFLYVRIDEGDYPIVEGSFRRHWKDICVQAAKSEAKDYAVVLCQALIELSFIETGEQSYEQETIHELPRLNNSGGGEHSFWVRELARVKVDGDPKVVDAAFNRILSFDFRNEEPPIMTSGNMDEVQQEYYQNVLNVNRYKPLSTNPEFPKMVEDLRNQVDELVENLKKREAGE
ncbi:hypothetical protein DMJ13_20105 [halophilic archaeon]|nr:hypothetical protein DMJ13_20105 [halophilic archaeon]